MNSQYAIGIDIGGSSLKCGLIDNKGNIIKFMQIPIENTETKSEVLKKVENVIWDCASFADCSVSGVGIGFPGTIEDGVVIGGGVNLPAFKDFPLAHTLSDIIKMPVFVDNDANMMALGEITYGSAAGCEDVIFITVGTGIGGAVLVGKKILGGYRNRGGELGHIIIQKDGKPCACGSKGCFETYASTRALVEQYKQRVVDVKFVNGEMIMEKFLDGDSIAVEIMQKHFDYMATGIASLVNIFSPQRIVIGGGISEAGDIYVSEIASLVKKIALPVAQQFTQILPAALGNRAGLLGCAQSIFVRYSQTQTDYN